MKFEKKVESSDDVWTGDNALSVDMDGDCIPELVIPAVREKSILIIDSNSGLTKWRISTPFIEFSPGSIAIAKFDEFSAPVVFLKAGIASSYPPNIRGRLMCYSADGSLKWISDSRYDIQLNNVGGKLALADFNQDGRPEVYLNNCIFNALTGVKLVDGGANGLGMESAYTFPLEALTVAAQFDTNIADLELAAGYTIYKVHIENIYGTLGNYMTAHNIKVDNFYRDGFTTVGDINTDGISDVIVACPGKDNRGLIYAYCLVNGIPELIAKIYSQSVEDYIGPPLVADIVGYDVPSIIVSRSAQLTAYSFNGSKVFKQDWMFVTTDSSGFTGVTAFDFNNDGVREIVFRDETFLRIINGSNSTPFEVAKIRCYSATRNEYPVVGDFDNTGKAKICVPCSLEPDGGFGKLFIIGPPDSLPGWAPARGIWNQYNYHVLNINDDLTVPRIQKSNATYKNGKYNNFLVQESLLDSNGMYKVAAANLWGEIDCIDYDPVAEEYTVTFNVFN
ncbi:MAG: VCBS repeat-containing protein, partial [Saprospiraceae bacterium]|nr:VCBS repeat-containing protein [Saprospiraceae bacterium]